MNTAVPPRPRTRPPQRVAIGVATLLGVLVAAVTPGPAARAQPFFADWESVTPGLAQGELGGIGVTLTSVPASAIDPENSITNESSNLFNDPRFTPPLAASDLLHIRASSPASSFTLTFDFPIEDPIIHLVSFASTATFPGLAPVKLSGDATLTVSGETVSGVAIGPPPIPYNDSNGTIQLPGTFTSITFTVLYPSIDGIYIQLGGSACAHITSAPGDQRACPGADVEFVVQGLGNPVEFQWRKDRVDIDPKSNPSAATPTLMLTGVGLADEGSYDLVVTGACGVLTSPPAALTICIADFNCDGVANSTDVSDFINQWFQDQLDGTLITDRDDNGVVNSTDVSGFINDWFADTAGSCA